MKLIHAAKDLGPGHRKVCLAIGVFDGVHLGHQQIIRQTVADARAADALALVVTFDRHPNAIVAPDKVPPLIQARFQKLHAIEELGADAVLEIVFDRAFSQQPGETFVRGLAGDLGQLQSVCVGADFVFGCRRSGNVPLLQKIGAELGFQVHGVGAVTLAGQVVSSTRIRECLRQGDLQGASDLLGRPYGLGGRVVAGDRIGRELGFPTANLDVTGMILPPSGVYAGLAKVDGQAHRVALNIGLRPTVASAQPVLRVEAHLLDFNGDLYGRELEVILHRHLRREQRFSSREGLREQILRDIAAVRELG